LRLAVDPYIFIILTILIKHKSHHKGCNLNKHALTYMRPTASIYYVYIYIWPIYGATTFAENF
jgi:hypothetical protein